MCPLMDNYLKISTFLHHFLRYFVSANITYFAFFYDLLFFSLLFVFAYVTLN